MLGTAEIARKFALASLGTSTALQYSMRLMKTKNFAEYSTALVPLLFHAVTVPFMSKILHSTFYI
jgi:hypothetical protein